jgi:hypothetical protein
MTDSLSLDTPQWRTLGDAELAVIPESKLGGALAIIVWCAAALVAGLVLVIAWLIAFGSFYSLMMMWQSIFGNSISAAVTRLSLIPQAIMLLWAAIFVAMTMARSASTPRVASIMIAIWAASAIGSQVAVRVVIAQGAFDPGSQATLLPYILFDIILASAFWGYMSEGRWPNIYFRKRVRA